MEFLYGYSVAADLVPGRRYDQVVEALGGHGELVRAPAELKPALARSFESGKPALVNVLTDPSVAYPRSSNLAEPTGRGTSSVARAPSGLNETARGGAGGFRRSDRTGRGTCRVRPV
jgi:hypothetical protein